MTEMRAETELLGEPEPGAMPRMESPIVPKRSIAGRALVYGFARMNIDGHFPRWGVAGTKAERTAEAVLDLFIAGIAKPDEE